MYLAFNLFETYFLKAVDCYDKTTLVEGFQNIVKPKTSIN